MGKQNRINLYINSLLTDQVLERIAINALQDLANENTKKAKDAGIDITPLIKQLIESKND